MERPDPQFDIRNGLYLTYTQGSLSAWLKHAEEQYEKALAPFISKQRVSKRTTGLIILFRGKYRRLALPKEKKSRQRSLFAVFALQWLYCLQWAMEKGEAVRAAEAMQGFIAFNVEVSNFDHYGTFVFEALDGEHRRRQGRVKGGENSAKWKKAYEDRARELFKELKRGKASDTAAYKRTATRLNSEFSTSLSMSTVKRHLTKRSAQQ